MYLHSDRMLKYSSSIWSFADLAEPEEQSVSASRSYFRLSSRWLILGVLLGMLGGWWGWSNWHIDSYRHVLQQNAAWVTDQSKAEMTCFAGTTTPKQELACARHIAQSVDVLQVRFNAIATPGDMRDAANKMQFAFNALTASSCYDSTNDTIDTTCVPGISARLLMAQLDARDALQN